MKKRFELSGCCVCENQINKSFNGYDPSWLSDFINDQCKTIKELERENQDLKREIVELQKALELAVESWCIMDNP